MISGDTTFQPTPPVFARPLYGTPPPPSPPSEPVYEAPPPPSPTPTEPVYEAPPPPIGPPCQPSPPSPTNPLYAVPPPPSPPGNCQPPMQNCVYPPPNTDVYQPIDSASDVPLYCLHILALVSLIFLPWLIC
ncbi:hypothetical protein L2E82_46082 [Cichorium intybus]|uniref:Uncharacterized protein n=1 Tax=Cichorium intybus TaxID=13427 RepID=A0ACB8YT57_CICIN|nr:hypothetical protein L2E82_46082 [Cichorium intybus]